MLCPLVGGRDESSDESKSGARFTEKQGHYLAFILTYAYMFGQPPAEADIQRQLRVSPPSVHQMIVTLERNGFIRRGGQITLSRLFTI
jgi:Mn-dependent DtxR family transcriptional regulator|nr:helix-turn-helix domain-containing protein [Bradyrhizobium sp. BR13661]